MSERALAAQKKLVADLKDKISRSNLMVISDYLGLSVKQITELRKKLYAEESEFRVIKNTLIERAVAAAGFPQLEEHLQGATALLLGYKDPVAPLKILVKFIKEQEKGALRAGVMDKNVYGGSELSAISKLPAREVLLGQAVRGLQAPIYGLVNVLQGNIRKLVYTLEAIRKSKA